MIQSAIALHIYRGGGLDPLQAISQANSADLANQSRKKVGTLTDPMHARTVTPRILQLNFFFSLLAKIRALPFPFLFPSLNLDLFQSSSGIRFGIPV
jgi:hypothetical protein